MPKKAKEKKPVPKGSDEHGKSLDPEPVDPPKAEPPPETPPATASKPSGSSQTEKPGSRTTSATRKPRRTSSKPKKEKGFINGILWD